MIKEFLVPKKKFIETNVPFSSLIEQKILAKSSESILTIGYTMNAGKSIAIKTEA